MSGSGGKTPCAGNSAGGGAQGLPASSERETQGFVWWATSLVLLLLYCVWVVLPSHSAIDRSALCVPRREAVLCRAAHIFVYVFPDKYWITAVPALLSALVLLVAVGYCGRIMCNEAKPTERDAWISRGEPPLVVNESSEYSARRQDVPLQRVSAALHLRDWE